MASLIKGVRGGTRGSKRLCDTCALGTVARGESDSEEMVACQIFDKVRMKVVECGSYRNKAVLSKYELIDIAWVITTKKAGRDIGFMKASDWKKANPDEEIL